MRKSLFWLIVILIMIGAGIWLYRSTFQPNRQSTDTDTAQTTTVPEQTPVVVTNTKGQTTEAPAETIESEAGMLIFTINGYELAVTPVDSSSVTALKQKMAAGPITIQMSDYGNFEKVGELPWSLPTNDTQITTVPGDVILYQGDKITIYYDTNSWNFTKLGHIDSVSAAQLREILGDTDVTAQLRWDDEN